MLDLLKLVRNEGSALFVVFMTDKNRPYSKSSFLKHYKTVFLFSFAGIAEVVLRPEK